MKEYTEEQKKEFRDRLKKVIGKKIQTTMIFPLSQFEMAFGELWGMTKPEDQLTESQKVYRQKWESCRQNVLNNGNNQRRNAEKEIDMHEVVWNRYEMVLQYKGDK